MCPQTGDLTSGLATTLLSSVPSHHPPPHQSATRFCLCSHCVFVALGRLKLHGRTKGIQQYVPHTFVLGSREALAHVSTDLTWPFSPDKRLVAHALCQFTHQPLKLSIPVLRFLSSDDNFPWYEVLVCCLQLGC